MGFRRRRWRELKPEEDKVRVNRAIRVPEVRVVNEDGLQLGVMATDVARDIAGRSGYDLVEISPGAQPPVCKIMDYGRYKYEQQKKAAVAKKAQHHSQIKEIKLRPNINGHDLDFKLRNARKFLLEGDKVKCTVMFRGREIVHAAVGRQLLAQLAESVGDVALKESEPIMERRTLSFTLAPNRAVIKRLKDEQKKAAAAEAAARAASRPDLESKNEDSDVEETEGAED